MKVEEEGGNTYYVAESCDWASLNCNPQAKLAEACAEILTISSWIFRSVARGKIDNRSKNQLGSVYPKISTRRTKPGQGNETDLLQDHIIPLLSLYSIPVSYQDHISPFPHYLYRQIWGVLHVLFLYPLMISCWNYHYARREKRRDDLRLWLFGEGGGLIYGENRPFVSFSFLHHLSFP